jgi:hypothetical protein
MDIIKGQAAHAHVSLIVWIGQRSRQLSYFSSHAQQREGQQEGMPAGRSPRHRVAAQMGRVHQLPKPLCSWHPTGARNRQNFAPKALEQPAEHLHASKVVLLALNQPLDEDQRSLFRCCHCKSET